MEITQLLSSSFSFLMTELCHLVFRNGNSFLLQQPFVVSLLQLV